MKAKTSNSSKRNVEELLSYPPSFIDRFMRFIQQIPAPYWLTYLALFILHSLLNNILSWVNGEHPAFTFIASSSTFPLWLWGPLAIMTYLDSVALVSLSNFVPLLDIPSETMQRLKYEFTNMPARSVNISSFVWNCIYVVFIYLIYPTYVAKGFGTYGIIYAILQGWGAFSIGSVIFYHTLRQLRLVHRTVKLVTQFDLFHLKPVYAFSVLTSRTSLAWVLLIILTFLMQRIEYDPFVYLPFLSAGAVFALAAFTLPLWVVHQRLVTEKSELLAEHAQRVKSTLARLHHSVDKNEMDDVPQLNSALDGLNTEGGILKKIRTWPWSTETLTGFLSAIVLPIILIFLQIAIQEWLNI